MLRTTVRSVVRGVRPRFSAGVVLLCVALMLSACAPTPSARTGDTERAAPQATTGPRTLRIALTTSSQPTDGLIVRASGSGEGTQQVIYALQNGLTMADDKGNITARIAEWVPSLDTGDWKAFPDGRMEVTWKLRPNVQWHDGTALSAEDYAFGMRVMFDNEIPAARSRGVQLMEQVTAPDPQTLVVTWKSPHFLANDGDLAELIALPRHLLQDMYDRGDRQALVNSQYWTEDFVGLGPYRVERWVPGNLVEARAFDGYFLGRPKIDRVIFQYFGDPNVVLATLLAGEADLATMGSFKYTNLPVLKSQWEEPGRGTVVTTSKGTRMLRVQYSDPTKPWVRDVGVRQAMLQMLDRQLLVDTLLLGTTTVAHTAINPDEPAFESLRRKGLPTYPHDLRRAQQLMGDAGWTRGPDGTYRAGTGDLFSLEVRNTAVKPGSVEETEAIAAQFKQAGLDVSTSHIPDEASNKAELRTKSPGLLSTPLTNSPIGMQHLHSSQISTEQNRYRGANQGAYSNPTFDQLFDQYLVTLETPRRNEILADLLKFEAEQVVTMYLYYDLSTCIAAIRKGLTGPGPVPTSHLSQSWNIHTWELN